MNYSALSLIELKQAAKGRRIKQYYIMKRARLIEILSLDELPQEMKIEKMTIIELRAQAKDRGIKGFWNLNREGLVELLYQAPTNKNKENQGDTDEHNDPQQHDAE